MGLVGTLITSPVNSVVKSSCSIGVYWCRLVDKQFAVLGGPSCVLVGKSVVVVLAVPDLASDRAKLII